MWLTKDKEMEKLKRLKAIQALLANEEMIKLMTDFRCEKFAGVTIVENQIENDEELAVYYLRQLEKSIFNSNG